MKNISKKKVTKVIELAREYWKTGNEKLSQGEIDAAKELMGEYNWSPIVNFVDGLIMPGGLNPDFTDEDFFVLLYLLGWRVTDEDEKSESL